MEAELLLKNIKYLDVYKKRFINGNIFIKDGKIIGINDDYKSKKTIDCTDKYLVPGFIDGHIHLESSIISPIDFSKIVIQHGTTSVITDPHEIANVCGVDGIKWMLEKTKNAPIDVFINIPSCVPATPFDESAYEITSDDVKKCFELDKKRILGLAEVMNYPGVINNDEEVHKKINIALGKGKVVDGHAPGVLKEDFKKYINAGITSDHECTTYEEAKEKLEISKELNKNFYIMIREGTAAKNLEALYKLFDNNDYKDYLMFVTDDKHPEELKLNGHIDYIIKKAINLGVEPIDAYIASSYNPTKYFKLNDRGSIEIGKIADLVILDDLNNCKIDKVIKNGIIITNDTLNQKIENNINNKLDEKVRNSIHMDYIDKNKIKVNKKLPIIELVKNEITTKFAGYENDYDIKNDIIKVIVIEPHKNTNHIGITFLKGMGLKEGAIGTTVAHDSHYMIAAGCNDEDIITVVNEMINLKGGKVVAKNGKVISELALPIANLMTDISPEEVIEKINELKKSVQVNEGIDPFMNLSFVSLAVINDIRLLPKGTFSVKDWKFY